MKYVNANVCCYSSITKTEDDRILSFNGPFDGIDVNNDKPVIKEFNIVTQFNFRGTNVEKNKAENPLETKKEIDVIIRFTKCAKEIDDRKCVDLDSFKIKLNSSSVKKACFPFFNYTRITAIKDLELPEGIGDYVIKVLVKYAGEDESKYSIQSMYSLSVK